MKTSTKLSIKDLCEQSDKFHQGDDGEKAEGLKLLKEYKNMVNWFFLPFTDFFYFNLASRSTVQDKVAKNNCCLSLYVLQLKTFLRNLLRNFENV